ncbi:MAG: hypothetical protein ACPGJN_05105 [Flavobacteriaceae bacterium]
MKKAIYLFIGFVFILSCSDEAYDSNTDNSNDTTADFSPSGDNDYWIYDVVSSSADVPEMNFTATDSIYISSIDENSFTLNANNNGVANGSMNILLTNGTISKTPTILVFDGTIDVPQNLLDLGFTQDLSIENMTLLNLEASNNEEMFVQESNFSETIDIMGTDVPVEISSRISTKKINFYTNETINDTNYNDVFEAEFTLNIGIIGTFSVEGFTQTIPILETQDVMKVTYFYVNNMGLVRAETIQGISLSSQLIGLLNFLDIPLDFPANVSIESIEELSDYSIE